MRLRNPIPKHTLKQEWRIKFDNYFEYRISLHKTNSFLLRKCCGPGQVYTKNRANNKNQPCADYRTPSQRESTFITVSQQLFFAHQNSSNAFKFKIDSGFPRNCSPDRLLVLEPESIPADSFYPLASGHLVVPHRFWLFQPDHYCTEELDENFNKVKRSAIICTERIELFPSSNAVDYLGRLNLDFLPGAKTSSGLTKLSGRRVIRKCCDINQVYSVAIHRCIPKQDYATTYFNDLENPQIEGGDLFFRVGSVDCPIPLLQTDIFSTSADPSKLLVKQEETDKNWQEVSLFCLEDFVFFFENDLHETGTFAQYCPAQHQDFTPSIEH